MDKHRPSWCSIRSPVSSPGVWCRTGTSRARRRGELSHDLSGRLHAGDAADALPRLPVVPRRRSGEVDRKSTRLNSSHGYISYAVFCLKKKKKNRVHSASTILGTRLTYTSITEIRPVS